MRSRTWTRAALFVVALVALAGTTALQAAPDAPGAPERTASDGSTPVIAAPTPGGEDTQTSWRLSPLHRKLLLCGSTLVYVATLAMSGVNGAVIAAGVGPALIEEACS